MILIRAFCFKRNYCDMEVVILRVLGEGLVVFNLNVFHKIVMKNLISNQ